MNVIEIKNLTKTYGKARGIADVSFNVEQGEIFGFIGPNGAGKSTTIRTLLSLIYPTSGSATIFGKDCIQFAPEIKKEIGYLPSEIFYYDNMKVKDLLKYSASFYKKDCSKRIKELAKMMDLDLNKKIDDLSLGNKKKVGIVQGLLHSPKVLFLDEPTSGLDPVAREEICEILQEFVEDEKHSVFFSTHITSDLEEIADYIIFLINGKIVYKGEKDNLMENYILIKGGMRELESLDQNKLIGIRKHATGFEAVSLKADSINLREEFIIEPISLEKLIIFFNRGEFR